MRKIAAEKRETLRQTRMELEEETKYHDEETSNIFILKIITIIRARNSVITLKKIFLKFFSPLAFREGIPDSLQFLTWMNNDKTSHHRYLVIYHKGLPTYHNNQQ